MERDAEAERLVREQARQGVSPYVIVRTCSAGCFAGLMVERSGREVTLEDVRRLWAWQGAASLSELATVGTHAPKACKFPAPVARLIVLEAVEIIFCTDAARASIARVPVWSAR